MPNPHFDVQIISRGNGKSAVASAAYRSGSKITRRQGGSSALAAASYRSGEALYDERAQKTYDYTRKEDVILTEIMLPEGAPGWLSGITREQLWNKVEGEKRKDAQLARDIIASLPRELNREQQIALTRAFVRENFTDKGMIADIAIHDKQASDGYAQPHLHIMLTMRDITAEGFGQKNRQWNDQKLVTVWRDSWETRTNEALEQAGSPERVSLKSNKERGIDKVPQEYMGYEAWALEQKGIETAKGERNRQARYRNKAQDAIDGLRPKEKQGEKVRRKAQKEREVEAAEPADTLGKVAKQLKPDDNEGAKRGPRSADAASRRDTEQAKAKNATPIGQREGERNRQAEERQAYRRYRQKVASILRSGPMRKLNPQTINTMLHGLRDRSSIYAKDAFTHFMLLRNSRELAEELEQERRLDKSYER